MQHTVRDRILAALPWALLFLAVLLLVLYLDWNDPVYLRTVETR